MRAYCFTRIFINNREPHKEAYQGTNHGTNQVTNKVNRACDPIAYQVRGRSQMAP